MSPLSIPTPTGRTRLYPVLADPVDHLRVPERLNRWFVENGYDAVVVPWHTRSAALGDAVQAIRSLDNVLGCGITIPHKIDIVSHLDELDETAAQCGAVNVVRRTQDGRLIGHQVDGVTLLGSLVSAGVDVRGCSVTLLGAGGAARPIAFAMAAAGISTLRIHNRSDARARELADAVSRTAPASVQVVAVPEPETADVIINATSLGMSDEDPLPMTMDRIAGARAVVDIVMKDGGTPFLRAAEAAGAVPIDGTVMLDAQFSLVAALLGLAQEPAAESITRDSDVPRRHTRSTNL